MGVLLGYRLFQLLMLPLLGAAASAAGPLPGCRTRCGEIDVPYPFGIGPNCSREGFSLDCNTTDDGLEKLFVFNVEITDISLPLGQTRMLNEISWQCYNVSNISIGRCVKGAAASAAGSLHGCRSRCGFRLDCSTTDDGLEKLFVFNVEIVNISLPLGQVRMVNEISW
ncbi:wall-associated receptor kinase 4-like [Musa acuminata AAA Group]|uniref:wall-associated receptor kinase 4-like n=1 Tax=Musa acuminata AAA Group TaxID=214697 RepID=UPI0031D8EB2D